MDKAKIQEGVKLILEGIGEDIHREGLVETPDRIARMYEELAAGYTDDAAVHLKKRFHVDNNDMVMEKDLPFYSFCEHFFLRTPYAAFLWNSGGGLYPGRGSGRIKQDCPYPGGFCKEVPAPGAPDRTDRRRLYERIKTPWSYGADPGGTYVHDNAGN